MDSGRVYTAGGQNKNMFSTGTDTGIPVLSTRIELDLNMQALISMLPTRPVTTHADA